MLLVMSYIFHLEAADSFLPPMFEMRPNLPVTMFASSPRHLGYPRRCEMTQWKMYL